MPPAGFEPTIPANEQSQIHALDRAAIGIREITLILGFNFKVAFSHIKLLQQNYFKNKVRSNINVI
jgi:hypothetical protein